MTPGLEVPQQCQLRGTVAAQVLLPHYSWSRPGAFGLLSTLAHLGSRSATVTRFLRAKQLLSHSFPPRCRNTSLYRNKSLYLYIPLCPVSNVSRAHSWGRRRVEVCSPLCPALRQQILHHCLWGYKNTCFSQIALRHRVQDSLPLFLVKRSADVTVWFFMSNPGSGPGLEPLKGSTDGLERLLHGHAGDNEGSQPRTAQHSSVGSPSMAQFSPADCPSSGPQAVPAQPSSAPRLSQPSPAWFQGLSQPSPAPGALPQLPQAPQPSTGAIPARPCPGSTVRVSGSGGAGASPAGMAILRSHLQKLLQALPDVRGLGCSVGEQAGAHLCGQGLG